MGTFKAIMWMLAALSIFVALCVLIEKFTTLSIIFITIFLIALWFHGKVEKSIKQSSKPHKREAYVPEGLVIRRPKAQQNMNHVLSYDEITNCYIPKVKLSQMYYKKPKTPFNVSCIKIIRH